MKGASAGRTATVLLLLQAVARAAGFEVPDHGALGLGRAGACVATACDGTAIIYNPAALASEDGTRLLLSSHIIVHSSEFTRAGTDPNTGAPFARVSNHAPGFWVPMLVASSQFGLRDWTFAVGVHGPNAYGRLRFPVDGAQRYEVIDTDFIVIHYSVAAAWRPHPRLSLGMTLEWVDTRIGFKQKVPLIAGTETPSTDVTSTVEVSDHFSPNVILGVRWELPAGLVFGFSIRPPIFVKATGTVKSEPPEGLALTQAGDSATLTVSYPVVARAGLAWNPTPRLNLEGAAVFEGWSVVRAYKTSFPGVSYSLFGAELPPVPNIDIVKDWSDTWSVRLGADVDVIPGSLTLRAGLLYETAATPTRTTALDFASFYRFGLSFGVTAALRGFNLSLGYAHIFQNDRDVRDSIVAQPVPVPSLSGAPTVVGNGLHKTSYDTFSASLSVHFDSVLR